MALVNDAENHFPKFWYKLDNLSSDFRSGDFWRLGGEGSRTAFLTGEKDRFGTDIPLEPSGHTHPPFTLMSTNLCLLFFEVNIIKYDSVFLKII